MFSLMNQFKKYVLFFSSYVQDPILIFRIYLIIIILFVGRAKSWYIDATFKVVKEPFSQLLSIHSFVKSSEGNYKQVLIFNCLN